MTRENEDASAQLGDHHPCLGLLEKPDDLLGRESALAHVRPLSVNGLYLLSAGTAGGGQVSLTEARNILHSERRIEECRSGGLDIG